MYDLAGITPSTIEVYLNGKKIQIKDFSQYVGMYLDSEVLKFKDKDNDNDRWEVIISQSEGQFQHVSFVNSICTSDGGTHVNYIAEQITDKLIETIKKKYKDLNIKPFQVKSPLWVFVNCLIENPAFSSQTKEQLTTKVSNMAQNVSCPKSF